MLASDIRTVLSQTSLVAKFAKNFTFFKVNETLEDLIQCLLYSSHLLHLFVHSNTIFFDLLAFEDKLLLLDTDTLCF